MTSTMRIGTMIHVTEECLSKWSSKTKDGDVWVLGVGPKFAHDITPPVSLYDLIEDINQQKQHGPSASNYDIGIVKFNDHIEPILSRTVLTSWVNAAANRGHCVGGPGYFYNEQWSRLSTPPNDPNRLTYEEKVEEIPSSCVWKA
ncbi:hypothetical protein BC936DRAFT_138793 [Jimgerdemannia flammicorona]|uniref:Uncharacterized protein n=1 Tax=Jimgerdemannia flammicorona TaxID=994334 RepID=A0A433BID3_9FUNG|nr:hypothetical protein BC936DRAFT_138793 [Jimgerdemannia flammicorona]